MQEAGYTKDSAGNWSKDGTRLTLDLLTPGWLKPMGPVVEKQLRDGGFDTTFKLFDPDTQPFFDQVRAGKADAWIIVHCGSSREPHGTLQHFHSRYASPAQGQLNSYNWANSQYMNPEYDAIINQMDQIQPSPTDAQYMDLTSKATNIFLRDVLEISLAEERHVVTFNNTYWTGWANASNAFVAPYSLWGAFLLEFLRIESGPGQ
jgi:peptide/nickel transport system substrate-binding protein